MEIHGDTRTDNYYWLRDDERSDDAVLSYLKAENAYTEACMRGEEALRQRLFSEMVERIPQEDESVPYQRNGYRYQSRYKPAGL